MLQRRHIGRKLVEDCLIRGKECGFKVLQFNAVVATNTAARRLYEGLGFKQLGTIPKGFRMKDGSYEDICPFPVGCHWRQGAPHSHLNTQRCGDEEEYEQYERYIGGRRGVELRHSALAESAFQHHRLLLNSP